ncbi:succinate--hydroxymethylglutarate CoA-transferase [Neocloeon triangulifer]|uniref:succinate--hydroxymethylglutarate CoA-transferase n=1 Tax=Neocloeon triangulifer TaxID=2078957 RepID=UPI00286F7350|nr:succinate--hydroxymethylglutarate CoA-transferase [Neocloeon triangulifer]
MLKGTKLISCFRRQFCSSSAQLAAPLEGVRIMDLTRIVAGPFCTMILADLGAEVIKVEHPKGGDECRNWGPPFLGGESCYFFPVNRNKKSICINLKSPEGLQVAKDLACQSDILMENYVPGKLASLGLGYKDLAALNPGLIYTSLTGYGPTGPYATRPGYDVIAASEGGLLGITGPRDGDPCKVGVAMTDIATGLYAHGAILAALLQKKVTGRGQKIDVNLLSTQVACLINLGSNYLNAGVEAKRLGTAHASLVPYESLQTKEGAFITICCGSNQQFEDFCKRIDLPELSVNPKFRNNEQRVINREELLEEIRARFKEHDSDFWLRKLKGGASPYGRVNSLKQVFEDPHVKDVGLVEELEHPTAGRIKVVGPPVKYSEAKNDVRLPPPVLGQHTDQVLRDTLGYSEDKVSELRKCSAVA